MMHGRKNIKLPRELQRAMINLCVRRATSLRT